MELQSTRTRDTLLVRVEEDRIDAAVAIQFKDAMRELAGTAAGRVTLDLGKVRFIDSSGLGAIVWVLKFLAPSRELELANLTPNVERVFKLTRMNEVFRILPTAPDAADADTV